MTPSTFEDVDHIRVPQTDFANTSDVFSAFSLSCAVSQGHTG